MLPQDIAIRLGVALLIGAVSASRNDAALEQIIGRMSLEPFVTAAHWQAEQTPIEG